MAQWGDGSGAIARIFPPPDLLGEPRVQRAAPEVTAFQMGRGTVAGSGRAGAEHRAGSAACSPKTKPKSCLSFTSRLWGV